MVPLVLGTRLRCRLRCRVLTPEEVRNRVEAELDPRMIPILREFESLLGARWDSVRTVTSVIHVMAALRMRDRLMRRSANRSSASGKLRIVADRLGIESSTVEKRLIRWTGSVKNEPKCQ